MERKFYCLMLCLTLVISNCGQSTSNVSPNDPNENFKEKNFSKYYYSLKFSQDFIPLDTSFQVIIKSDFFKKILNENFVPVKKDSNNSIYYQLAKASPTENQLILIKALAGREYTRYQMEGKPLPNFYFKDLDGEKYNNDNTHGKILVIKLWFIGCVPCVQEFPAVNKVVDHYKNRNDIQFISLAFDKAVELKLFLKNNSLRYATIPNQKKYIVDSLKVTSFPTHIIVNKKGEVIKSVSTCSEMETILEQEASK